jgi:hypothetical protein
MKLPRPDFFRLAEGAAALPAIPGIAAAPAYPARPVRIVVGFPCRTADQVRFGCQPQGHQGARQGEGAAWSMGVLLGGAYGAPLVQTIFLSED